jgi:hypothetical protein
LQRHNRRLALHNHRLTCFHRRLPGHNRRLPLHNRRLPRLNRRLLMHNRRLQVQRRWLPRLNRRLWPPPAGPDGATVAERRSARYEQLEVGTRVIANWGADWDTGVVVSVDEETAHVDFLRLAEGFNEDIALDLIRIPLTKDDLDPALLTTVKFELFRGTNLTSKDLPRVEEALLRLEGYVSDTAKLTSRSRQLSFVVVRESFAERFAGHVFLELKIPHGRQLQE